MANKELSGFLLQQCKKRGLSLRRLSINSGLGAATVYSIITGKRQPTLRSLNRLADYLNIKREYLWQLAGLLEDMDYDTEAGLGDPRLRFQFARVDKLSQATRNVIISVVDTLAISLDTNGAEEKKHAREKV